MCHHAIQTVCGRCKQRIHLTPKVGENQTNEVELNAFISTVFHRPICQSCRAYIQSLLDKANTYPIPDDGTLIADIHYYMENDLFVFTDIYHIQKGGCCKNGCRHCPYGFRQKNED